MRGTWAATDVLTDMSLASEPFTGLSRSEPEPSGSTGQPEALSGQTEGPSGPFEEAAAGVSGYAHHGMLEAAKWLAENESRNLRALLTRHRVRLPLCVVAVSIESVRWACSDLGEF